MRNMISGEKKIEKLSTKYMCLINYDCDRVEAPAMTNKRELADTWKKQYIYD